MITKENLFINILLTNQKKKEFFEIVDRDFIRYNYLDYCIIWFFCNLLEASRDFLYNDFFNILDLFKNVLNNLNLNLSFFNEKKLIHPMKLIHIILKNLRNDVTKILGGELLIKILEILNKFYRPIEDKDVQMHYIFITFYLIEFDYNDRIKEYILKNYNRILVNIIDQDYDYSKDYNTIIIRIFGELLLGEKENIDVNLIKKF